jgi:hypothetical protein
MRKGGPDHTGPPSAKNLRGSAGPRRRHSYLGLPQQSLYTLPEPHGHLSFGCGINSSSCSSISHSPAIERDSQEKNDAQLDSVPRSGRMVAPHLPTEILAANLRVTYRKVGFSATTYMQKKPLARAIQQLERRISRDKDWVADDTVWCELLSQLNSLIIRENTGNYRDFGRPGAALQPNKLYLLSGL